MRLQVCPPPPPPTLEWLSHRCLRCPRLSYGLLIADVMGTQNICRATFSHNHDEAVIYSQGRGSQALLVVVVCVGQS